MGICSSVFPKQQKAEVFAFSDGGNLDNSGLMALLQRQAKKAIWIASTWQRLDPTYDYAGATPKTFDPEKAKVIGQLAGKFGYGHNNTAECLGQNQVFKKELLLDVVRKIVALQTSGKPAVVRFELEVQPNRWWGIRGGNKVDILLIYLEKCGDFEEGLPKDTRDALKQGTEGPFAHFPTYATTNQTDNNILGLTSCQINLLAAQGEYSVRENIDLFKDFLS